MSHQLTNNSIGEWDVKDDGIVVTDARDGFKEWASLWIRNYVDIDAYQEVVEV